MKASQNSGNGESEESMGLLNFNAVVGMMHTAGQAVMEREATYVNICTDRYVYYETAESERARTNVEANS